MGLCRDIALLAFTAAGTEAGAASLQVSPVHLEVFAPGASTTITVRNTDVQPLSAQVRVFRWTQAGGQDRLEPTEDVVASPPTVELKARQNYTVRVVRVARHPVQREESYRLVIDELPQTQSRTGTVALVLRHVVPLFFSTRDASPAAPVFSVTRRGKSVSLAVENRGDRRMRLASVGLRDASGRTVPINRGLLGYALGRSSMSWPLPAGGATFATGSRVTISGTADSGPFNATSIVQTAP